MIVGCFRQVGLVQMSLKESVSILHCEPSDRDDASAVDDGGHIPASRPGRGHLWHEIRLYPRASLPVGQFHCHRLFGNYRRSHELVRLGPTLVWLGRSPAPAPPMFRRRPRDSHLPPQGQWLPEKDNTPVTGQTGLPASLDFLREFVIDDHGSLSGSLMCQGCAIEKDHSGDAGPDQQNDHGC